MNSSKNDEINKGIDNELKKAELSTKYGGLFSRDSNLPPEIEGAWLKSIEQFEEQHTHCKQLTVWEYINQPDYKGLEELSPTEVANELDRLMRLMNEKGVSLDSLCEVDVAELYRFIIEELFIQKIDDIKIDGMMNCFIYEEFHPNAKKDIEQAFDYFFSFTLAKHNNIGGEGYDLLYVDTANYKGIDGSILDKQKVFVDIHNFLNSCDRFEVLKNDIKDVIINEAVNDAVVNFNIHYRGLFDHCADCMDYEGNGQFKMKPSEFGGWDVYHINMPGFAL